MPLSTYFSSATFINMSLSLVATLAVLGWVYHRSRLPAALANLVWALLSQSALPFLTQQLAERTPGLRQGPIPLVSALGLWSLVMTMIQSGLFVWLLVSLVQWARSGTHASQTQPSQNKPARPLPITEG